MGAGDFLPQAAVFATSKASTRNPLHLTSAELRQIYALAVNQAFSLCATTRRDRVGKATR